MPFLCKTQIFFRVPPFPSDALTYSEKASPFPSAREEDGMTGISEQRSALVTLTADIVSAHVANNSVAVAELPLLIRNVHGALNSLGKNEEVQTVRQEPAVSVRASVKPDYLICLEDGKKLKMLKRHLMTHYQMSPAEYRVKWNLRADYPMVAPNYAEQRRNLARKIGLGRKPRTVPSSPAPKADKAPVSHRPGKKASVAEQQG